MILITGGIGSGKSVVSRILRANGFEVYDSDTEARRLMDSSDDIKHRLNAEIAAGIVDTRGCIDRLLLARLVFADAAKLRNLNAIVHGAVREDIAARMSLNPQMFVETAIPVSSGLVDMADEVWQIEAPEMLRIRRVMARNHISADAVRDRIEAQRSEYVAGAYTILNDDRHSILTAVLQKLYHENKL